MSSDAVSPLQAEVNRLRLQLQTLQANNASEPIEVGNYLLARLEQLKVTVRRTVPLESRSKSLMLGKENVRRPW
jgi:pyruvate decarboxylase